MTLAAALLSSFLLAGCAGAVAEEPLPAGHPANPDATETPYSPPPPLTSLPRPMEKAATSAATT